MKNTRQIIRIDEEKCNGCGQCANACAEGAIQIINGKAKLVSETYCDGLGACLGTCPTDAIHLEERAAEPFDEQAVAAHLGHTPPASSPPPAPCPTGGCPGSMARLFARPAKPTAPANAPTADVATSSLEQWPIQLHLVSPRAPYWQGADLLVAADCTAFALGGFHGALLAGRRLVIACPKLDDKDGYVEKMTAILRDNEIKSVTVAIMEVPCCQGLRILVEQALKASGKILPYRVVAVGLEGTMT